MRSVKIYNADTKCIRCANTVSRARAEAADWIEVTYVDQTGMSISKAVVCNLCAENWEADVYTVPPATPPKPGTTVSQVAV